MTESINFDNVITEYKGSPKAIHNAIKQMSIPMVRTTKDGAATYRIEIPAVDADPEGEF